MAEQQGFAAGIGRWVGTAEVYSGDGRFLGNGADTRHVEDLGNGRVQVTVSFVGPFKHAGHYIIENHTTHRLYRGPANVGYAEALGSNLVDANAYWPSLGLSQRFVLVVLPDGNTQLSLALMTRGEQVIYVVVGQNDRVVGDNPAPPSLVSGTSYDFASDPTAGRGTLLLHRTGVWHGLLSVTDAQGVASETAYNEQHVQSDGGHEVEISGGFAQQTYRFVLQGNDYHAWTPPEQPIAGSYSLSGGRALSGQFHHLDTHLRVWRREVVSHDGTQKAVLHTWYRGGERIAVQHGVLAFSPEE